MEHGGDEADGAKGERKTWLQGIAGAGLGRDPVWCFHELLLYFANGSTGTTVVDGEASSADRWSRPGGEGLDLSMRWPQSGACNENSKIQKISLTRA
jgi:hypothetical protein